MKNRFTLILTLTSALCFFGLTAKAQSTGPTIGRSVYGGGKGSTATVTGAVFVEVKAGTVGTNPPTSGVGDVYGGGQQANVDGSTTVNLKGGTVYGDLYGGGALANVSHNTIVTLSGGSTRLAFGGGMGSDSKAALVEENAMLTLDGATLRGKTINTSGTDVKGGAFGGCNIKGTVKGTTTVEITKTTGASDNHVNIYGGGLGEHTNVQGSVIVNVGANVFGDIYGGSAKGLVNYAYNNDNIPTGPTAGNGIATTVTLTSGTVTGDIYGGGHGLDGESANVGRPVTVAISGGTVTGNVFGCNNENGAPQDTVGVVVSGNSTIVTGDVYGGGNLAAYEADTVGVTISGGTVNGRVFGGGNNISIANKGVRGSLVEMTGGLVEGGIYGGCNENGVVEKSTVVNVIGGTVGMATIQANDTTVGVYGGGLGPDTKVLKNVTVTVSRASGNNAPDAPTIYGDVYGGSGFGNVNSVAADKTTVNILDGAIRQRTMTVGTVTKYYGGNVYGGGLGDKASLGTGHHDYVALVNGEVTVNIGSAAASSTQGSDQQYLTYSGNATIEGSVYGCNNTNGSPQDNVTVNVYATAHTDGTGGTPNNTVGGNAYAIDNVFGGGNEANYTPASANKKASVRIYSCDNTIRRTFGGGNAANVGTEGTGVIKADVATDILGGRFAEVYGGGNGERGENYAANIYGNVALGIHGGDVGMFFVGSNQHGTIEGNSTVGVDESGCGSIQVDEFFCGGNYADFVGDIDATISCSQGMHVTNLYGGCNQANVVSGNGGSGNVHLKVYGGTFDNVYGGSKGTPTTPANIAGDVTLDIYGGTIDTVFGGSNINGNIFGKITVNIFDLEHEPCGLTVHNVYGGGRDAAYTPTIPGAYPEVNVIHGAVSKKAITDPDTQITTYWGGKVFGGGYGEKATVSSNPKVRIGYDATMTGLPTTISTGYASVPLPKTVVVDSLVFGGGDMAAVAGSTEVIIQKANVENASSSALGLFGGGNKASVGNATVGVLGGNVTAGVYGGCNEEGTVGGEIITLFVNTANNNSVDTVATTPYYPGTIAVNIMNNLGTSSNLLAEGIYGGGKGGYESSTNHGTFTTGTVTVTIGDDTHAPTIYSDIYGGSAFGQVSADGLLTKVDFKKGELHGIIYGGGQGDNTHIATVSGNTEVAIGGGTIIGSAIPVSTSAAVNGAIFGGCNVRGVVLGNATVGFTSGIVGSSGTHANVYGGGLGQHTTVQGSVAMNLGSSTIYGDVYGGSAKGKVNYNYNTSTSSYSVNDATGVATTVTLDGASVTGNIYGGGHGLDGESADVGRAVVVNVNSGSINTYGSGDANGGNVFGCNNEYGAPKESVQVNINNDVTKNVYGGGNLAACSVSPAVCVNDGIVGGNVYGGGLGTSAVVTGAPSVTVGTAVSNDGKQATVAHDVYGGGDAANVVGTTSVLVRKCNTVINGDVYGGGNAADIKKNSGAGGGTSVTITGGTINANGYGNVFGGGHGNRNAFPDPVSANVEGNTSVTVNGGTIGHVFGGSNSKGDIDGATTVTVEKDDDACSLHITEVYGGGNLADGKAGTITIGCTGGTDEGIGDVYGGAKAAGVTGDITLNITGGKIDRVFGGNNESGVINGNITVNIEWGTSCSNNYLGNVYGGGNLAAYGTAGSNYPQVNLINGTVSNNVFGGGLGASARVTGNPVVNINGGVVSGNVFGGGSQAPVTGNPTVNAYKGQATNIYAGGLGSTASVTGDPTAVVNQTSGQTMTVTDVFGGGDQAVVQGNTTVQLLAGTVTRAFGGGNVADITGTTTVTLEGATVASVYGGGNEASVSSTSTVTVSSGNVTAGLYGGCNFDGDVGGKITVSVTGGTIGADGATANVHGGGYGNNTSTSGDVEVDISGESVAIWGDVYGGSALGNINDESTDNTTVTLSKGTIHGDLYGGGLGNSEYAAAVNGAVLVTVNGGTVNNVFGCNNENGAPQSTVQVNIEQTGSSMSVNNVFGGGNLAQYTGGPQVNVKNGTVSQNVYGGGKGVLVASTSSEHGQKGKVTGNPQVTIGDNVTGHTAHVTGDVYGGGDAANVAGTPVIVVNDCNTTIGYLYGGGNAADVSGTDITVNAGTINHQAFGGGHGDKTITQEPLKYADVNGNVVFKVYGGTIPQVFAGSNSKGSITGTSNLTINKTSESCPMKLGEVYGGGNEADGNAGTITIGCTGTWTTGHNTHNSTDNRIGYELEGIGTVYGGANMANIVSPNGDDSDILLNINSGIIDTIFGGNNQSGTISGTITVNVNKNNSTCDWYVGNVFGGGNQATYGSTGNNYPQVNILNGTVTYDVFGGGLGSTGDAGKVTGNPQVTVNGSGAAVNGGVYGGGSLAPTDGNPQVTLTNGALTKVFGGGKAANVDGAPTVAINGGTVSTGVYGGCNTSGEVSGNITVNITNGTIGTDATHRANVHGGGYGEGTSTTGNVTVNFGVAPNTYPADYAEFPKIYGDIYGGSALGSVNNGPEDKTTVNILNGTLVSNVDTGGSFPVYYGGNVFGGGLGEAGAVNVAKGQVNGVVTVNIGAPAPNGRTLNPDEDQNLGNATIQGCVYGCNNTNGSPQDSVMVHIYRTYRADDEQINYSGNNPKYAIANVFGGGNEANYVPLSTAAHKKLKVMIHGCYNSVRRVFGGSNAAASGNSSISTTVSTNIDGGRFYQVFGGGNGEVSAANIYGDLDLRIHGGIVEQFYGASNQNGTITGNINTVVDNTSGCQSVLITEYFCGGNYANIYGDLVSTITCSEGMEVTSLYGGCNQANIYGDVVLNLCGGTYTNVFGGSKGVAGGISADILAVTQAVHDAHPEVNLTVGHGGNVTLNLYGGTIKNVYGGSNIHGNIEGNITVNVIDAESTTCPLYVTNIYGGSNLTDYVPDSVNHVATTDPNRISPVVNVMHAKYGILGNVYGGSKGEVGATTPTKVMANPKVNIGYDSNTMGNVSNTSSLIYQLTHNPNYQSTTPPTDFKSTIQGSVFGGGDAAKVKGNTEINLNKHAKVMQNVYGGGNMGEVEGDTKVIVNGKRQ